MLTAADPVDWNPRRIAIAGTSGAGKSTLARRIAALLELPYTELDSLYHGPNWTPRPSFVEDVDRVTAAPGWVTEWQYRDVRGRILERADTLMWLDLPNAHTMARLTRRTLSRRLRRRQLWNGNVEPPLRTIFRDPDHIIRWGYRTRNKLDAALPAAAQAYPHLRVVRLRSQRDVDVWVRQLPRERT